MIINTAIIMAILLKRFKFETLEFRTTRIDLKVAFTLGLSLGIKI